MTEVTQIKAEFDTEEFACVVREVYRCSSFVYSLHGCDMRGHLWGHIVDEARRNQLKTNWTPPPPILAHTRQKVPMAKSSKVVPFRRADDALNRANQSVFTAADLPDRSLASQLLNPASGHS